MKTWREIISLASGHMREHSVPDAESAAEFLAARLLRCPRGSLLSEYFEKPVCDKHLEAMRRGMKRLCVGEPLQYVLGEWDFRSLTLKCDRRALIPRPETEQLVERVLRFMKGGVPSAAGGKPLIVDVGTGSGCIILSLAKEASDGIFLGIDVSPEAVTLACENAKLCELDKRVKFAVADGLDEFDPETIDIIVSNPPYVTQAEYETLDPRVKNFEPATALLGGETGLDFYDRFTGDAMNVLKPGGALFFEIGERQGPALEKMLADYGFEGISIEKDFSGHNRYAMGHLPQ